MNLFNKNTPLEKGVKLPYRTYLLLSWFSAAACMILIGLSTNYPGSDGKAILNCAGCGIVALVSIVRMRLDNNKLIERRDELAYFHQLKTVQTLAVTAICGFVVFIGLSQTHILTFVPLAWYYYCIAFICILYPTIFCYYDRKGE